MLAADPKSAEQGLRTLALALPEAAEKLSHGAPAFFVAGKMFAYFSHDHHGDGVTYVGVKTSGRDEQDLLIEADPDTYSWPAYTGGAGWIALSLAKPDWTLVEVRLATSWRLAAPKRLLR